MSYKDLVTNLNDSWELLRKGQDYAEQLGIEIGMNYETANKLLVIDFYHQSSSLMYTLTAEQAEEFNRDAHEHHISIYGDEGFPTIDD